MKTLFLLGCTSFVLISNFPSGKTLSIFPDRSVSLSCAAPVNGELEKDESGKFISVLPGWGKHTYKISTSSDSAQFYFNQGLNLYYSYHLKQALGSFKEAARFDSSSAMAYWGQALAMGPFYNEPVYKMNAAVPNVIAQMISHRAGASEKELGFIDAMKQRYSNDLTNADRAKLDQAYTAAMAALLKTYNSDPDIKGLYIDAVMLQHKWDFWNNDGSPKAWTPELVKYCEDVIKTDAMHPAGLHYYIHVTEASQHPELALKSADALKDAMPGTAHMVHMASHMYQRNGLFEKGVEINEAANTASNIADSLHKGTGNGQNTTIHYFAVQSYCALSAGMYESAMAVYQRARKRVVELNEPLDDLLYGQFVYSIPTIAAVRSGKWEAIQQEPDVSSNWKYAVIMQEFAKGLADVRQNKLKSAQARQAKIEKGLSDSSLYVTRKPFNKPVQSCRIASALLKAEIFSALQNSKAAVPEYEKAIKEEDNLIYAEPQEWMLPVRQYYGAFLLKNKRAKQAEEVFKKDLDQHPGNGWALLGLYQSLTAQKKKEADEVKPLLDKAFASAEARPVTAVF